MHASKCPNFCFAKLSKCRKQNFVQKGQGRNLCHGRGREFRHSHARFTQPGGCSIKLAYSRVHELVHSRVHKLCFVIMKNRVRVLASARAHVLASTPTLLNSLLVYYGWMPVYTISWMPCLTSITKNSIDGRHVCDTISHLLTIPYEGANRHL